MGRGRTEVILIPDHAAIRHGVTLARYAQSAALASGRAPRRIPSSAPAVESGAAASCVALLLLAIAASVALLRSAQAQT